MDLRDTKKRVEAAYKLLTDETTSKEKFESIRTLIKDINPKLDSLLENTSKILSDIEKFQKGDTIILSAEHLPENTEEEKERKRKLLLLINSYRELSTETKRIKAELENNNSSSSDKLESAGKIIAFAKGPFGLITLVAIIIVGASIFFAGQGDNNKTIQTKTEVLPAQTTPSAKPKIQVIIFNGKKLPLKDLHVGLGAECTNFGKEAEHFHALHDNVVKSLDGELVSDPGGCGFGKVNETEIVEIE